METMKWWQGDWFERQAINRAAAELQALDATSDGLSRQVARLFELDRDQGRELARLQASVRVLAELLVEAQVVDEGVLMARLGAALAALEPKPASQPSAPGGDPYRGAGAGQAAPAERHVRCGDCGCQVPERFTLMTAAGEVCDRCYQARTSQR